MGGAEAVHAPEAHERPAAVRAGHGGAERRGGPFADAGVRAQIHARGEGPGAKRRRVSHGARGARPVADRHDAPGVQRRGRDADAEGDAHAGALRPSSSHRGARVAAR